MTRCAGLAGRLFGHRFRARYSTEEKRPLWTSAGIGSFEIKGQAPQLHEQSSTYEGDVCERCGERSDRLSTPEEPDAADD